MKRLAELNAKAEDPNLWSSPERAQKIMRERTRLDNAINGFAKLERDITDTLELIVMAEAENDPTMVADAEATLKTLSREVDSRELEALFSGEADGNDTYLEVHSGAGGTESQDWARMLLRMYTRFAEQHDFKVDLIEESEGEEAGIKSATLHGQGRQRLRLAEVGSRRPPPGPHLAVRLQRPPPHLVSHPSPSTRWSMTRSRSRSTKATAGSTSTARPAPVASTSTRPRARCGSPTFRPASSLPRRPTARSTATAHCAGRCCGRASTRWNCRSAKMRRCAEANANKTAIGWGHQIRSYVLQPYQMVKDLRTGVESGNPAAVLDGGLDKFVEAELARRVHGGASAPVADID